MSRPSYTATLRIGQTYRLDSHNMTFEFGVPKIVSAEIADYLYSNATTSVLVKTGNMERRELQRRFEIEQIEDGEAEDDLDDDSDDGDDDDDGDAGANPAAKPAAAKPARSRARKASAAN